MIDLHIDADTATAEVVLNNPKALNAVAEADLAELSEALGRAADSGVRALLLRGEGRGFCAGRNIRGLTPAEDDAYAFLAEHVTPVLRRIAEFPAPTFAAVHGPCLGVGLGLAASCDIVYLAEDARVGSPFAKLGATLDSGGHHLFTHRLGSHRAMDLIVTGELLTGAEAVAAGLFSRAVPAGELLDFTRGKARAAARGATRAYLASRELIAQARDGASWWESIEAENRAQGELCSSEDYAEGFAAFNAKREPVFHGR